MDSEIEIRIEYRMFKSCVLMGETCTCCASPHNGACWRRRSIIPVPTASCRAGEYRKLPSFSENIVDDPNLPGLEI